ncbi:uncharacterized protein BX664DRAFT_323091 [Halteromyces radiatus]|uniref:uncharacterized protein n=1 Tax=Halteromyces radiatus TaxID=101107 RepID=UPI0022204170|nr:uncharacterized protein BX664DRAFT_323091 [Halteromyces radiatus]KAI8100185.1 hypothetical protein BX664DRAFT_323091 [Halteromyces radiatus]
METSQCRINPINSLLQHVHSDKFSQKQQWSYRPDENTMSFRSKRTDNTKHDGSFSLSIKEFVQYNHPDYSNIWTLPCLEFFETGRYSPSCSSSSCSSRASRIPSNELDDQGQHLWLQDFNSFSISSTSSFRQQYHSHNRSLSPLNQTYAFTQLTSLTSTQPSLIGSSNFQSSTTRDETESWDRVFDCYENRNDNVVILDNDTNIDTVGEIRKIKTEENDGSTTIISNQLNIMGKSSSSTMIPSTLTPNNDDIPPVDAIYWYELGISLQDMEQDKDAIDAFQQALALDPSMVDAWLGLAISYTNEHQRGKAYDCLEKWLENNGKYMMYSKSSNKNNIMKDRYTSLVDQYLAVARSAPGNLGTTHVRTNLETNDESTPMDEDVQVILGILFYLADDMEKARDCFQAALICRPHDYRLWNQLGSIMMAQSNGEDDALDMYYSALDLNPSYVRARYNLSIAYMKRAQYDLAAQHLVTALYQQQEQQQHQRQGRHSTSHVETTLENKMPSPLWSSLRLVMYMLNLDHLADACNRYDLAPFESFLETQTSSHMQIDKQCCDILS